MNSTEFKAFESSFCDDIDLFFKNSNLTSRYYRCFFDYIGAVRPHTLTFIMVFNGTDSVSREQTTGVISAGAPHYTVENLDLMFIGSNFFYLHRGYNKIAINLTDFTTTSAPPTTESPLKTLINITFVLKNLTYTNQLANTESQEFKSLAVPFCGYLTDLYSTRDRFKYIYELCQVMAFVQEGGKDKINFILQFKGAQDPTLQEFIYGILIENAPRAIVNGEISIIVGPLAVFDDSLAINQATVTYSLPPESTTPSSPLTAAPLVTDPCKDAPDNAYLPVPGKCHQFYKCSFGISYMFECPGNTVFFQDRNQCDNNDGTIKC